MFKKEDRGRIHKAVARLRAGAGTAWKWIGAHMTRKRAMRLGWYASLIALLVLLGTASYSYRNRGTVAAAPEAETPMAAIARYTPAPPQSPEPTPEPLRYVWPVEGEVIGPFAPDSLAWSQTMGQWQTHPAVDIAASPGEAVAACADGVVADAWRDPLWGNVIAIDHPDGRQSTYAGLSTLNLVNAGDPVKAGQVIGGIGNTAACEADMPWHLHFSLTADGEALEIEKILSNDAM